MNGKKIAFWLFVIPMAIPISFLFGGELYAQLPNFEVYAKLAHILSATNSAPGVQASVSQSTIPTLYAQPNEVDQDQTAPATWEGVPPSNETWGKEVQAGSVVGANGKSVSLKDKTAVLFVAPWCKYCHATLQLLQREGLLSKVTIVNVAINGTENDGPPPVVDNVKEAEAVVQKSYDENHIYLQAANTLFAMPQSTLNQEIQSYPTLLVYHSGWFYVQNGYVDNAVFWERLLG